MMAEKMVKNEQLDKELKKSRRRRRNRTEEE